MIDPTRELNPLAADPSVSSDDAGAPKPFRRHRIAVLACRSTGGRKWGVRWLERSGFEVHVTGNGSEAVELMRSVSPSVAVLDGGLYCDGRVRLAVAVRGVPECSDVPILTLCANDRTTREAIDDGCAEVARKPFNWQIIARRAEHLATMRDAEIELEQVRAMLDRARDTAEQAQSRIRRNATMDPMTGLPTRSRFLEILDGVVRSHGIREVAVLMVDFDRFNLVNQTLGRELGNDILRVAADRLKECSRVVTTVSRARSGPATSAVARLNGDEFALMITGLSGAEDANSVAWSLVEALGSGFQVGNDEVFLTASVGVALTPEDGDDAETLVQHAELALYEAKRTGGGMVQMFQRRSAGQAERSLVLTRELRKALENGDLQLNYQPLLDTKSRGIIGAEALLRWTHPEHGPISPTEFVPLAEETGLMAEIGTWVLRTACRQLRTWIDDGMAPIRMAVNVSVCQLLRTDLCETVQTVLDETGIDAGLLELELSERGALRQDRGILSQLQEIKELGVRLAVDDFGTGESAIAYLKGFPLDVLKIDRSYIHGVTVNDHDAAITAAMIAMAHQLNLLVVAEGVETEPQLEFLRERGCDELQGFLFYPAVPPEDFRQLLDES